MAGGKNISANIALTGEQEFKASMSQVNAALKEVSSSLRLSESDWEGQANTVEALTEKNKLLAQQYDLQKSKVEELRQAVKKSAEVNGENSNRTKELQTQLNNATVKLNDMSRALDENSALMEEAQGSTEGVAASIDEYGNKVKDAAAASEAAGNSMASAWIKAGKALVSSELISKVVKLAKKLWEVASAGAEYADNIITVSKQTRINTKDLQTYYYAAELVDVSVNTMTSALTKNIRSMESARDGTGEAADAYERLGVQIKDSVTGELRDSNLVFWETIDALGRMSNLTERDATAMTILGKNATELNTLIDTGSAGMAQMRIEAEKTGYILSDESLESLGKMDDATQRLKNQMVALKNAVGDGLAPMFEDIVEGTTKVAGGLTNLINNSTSGWRKLFGTIGNGANSAFDKSIGQLMKNTLPDYVLKGDDLQASLNGVAEALQAAYNEASGYSESLQLNEDQQAVWNELLDTTTDKLKTVAEAYKANYDAAYSSAKSVSGLFNTLSAEITLNTDDMKNALDSQTEYWTTYTKNLQMLETIGIDEGLIKSLSSGTEEAAGYVAAIADELNGLVIDNDFSGVTETVKGLNDAWREADAAMQAYSLSIAGDGDAVVQAYNDIAANVADVVNEFDKSSEMQAAAQDTIQGFLDGLGDGSAIAERMASIAANALAAFNGALEIGSPSKEMYKSAKWTVIGFTDGIREGEQSVRDAMSGLGNTALSAFNSANFADGIQSIQGGGAATVINYNSTVNTMEMTEAQTDYLVQQMNRRLVNA